jgi:hypothetical protein
LFKIKLLLVYYLLLIEIISVHYYIQLVTKKANYIN